MSSSADMWNSRYAKEHYAYGKEPNVFFKEELEKLTPGGILLPAEGEGRNAVHALAENWRVVCFDQSVSARDKALKLAEERGVELEYTIADALTYTSPVIVDALAYCYLHLPLDISDIIYARMNSFLAPGGALIFEAFAVENLGKGSGGPQVESMLMTVDRVSEMFKDFSELEVWQEEVYLSEGMYHEGSASVIRARGRK